jgi:hypothetical protein
MNNPLVEFAVIIVLFSVLGSTTIAFLPVISFWAVFTVCTLVVALHFGHGCLFMLHMKPLIAGHPKQARMESGMFTMVAVSAAVTVILLLMFTTAMVLTA